MSGRAGRRNKDDKGIVIVMVDEVNSAEQIKHILTGKADPLNSSFHLGYVWIFPPFYRELDTICY